MIRVSEGFGGRVFFLHLSRDLHFGDWRVENLQLKIGNNECDVC